MAATLRARQGRGTVVAAVERNSEVIPVNLRRHWFPVRHSTHHFMRHNKRVSQRTTASQNERNMIRSGWSLQCISLLQLKRVRRWFFSGKFRVPCRV